MKLNRQLLSVVTILFFSINSANSQSFWRNREDSLWNSIYNNKTTQIDSTKRWEFFLTESGSLGRLQVWFERKDTINSSFLTEQKN